MRRGGPCAGPFCGATEIKGRWRYGKGEHAGKPCCVRNKCRVALGILDSAVPYPAPKDMKLAAAPAAVSFMVPQVPWLQVVPNGAFMPGVQQSSGLTQLGGGLPARLNGLGAAQSSVTPATPQQLAAAQASGHLPMAVPLTTMGTQMLMPASAPLGDSVPRAMGPGPGGAEQGHRGDLGAQTPVPAAAGWNALLAAAAVGSAGAAGQPTGQPANNQLPASAINSAVLPNMVGNGTLAMNSLPASNGTLPSCDVLGGTTPGATNAALVPNTSAIPLLPAPTSSNGAPAPAPNAALLPMRALPSAQLRSSNRPIAITGSEEIRPSYVTIDEHAFAKVLAPSSDTKRLLEVYEIVGYQQDPAMYRISGAFSMNGEVRKAVCWLAADEVHTALKDTAHSHGALPLMELMQRFAARSTDEMCMRVRALGLLM